MANRVDSKGGKSTARKRHTAHAAMKGKAPPLRVKKWEPKQFCAIHLPLEKRRIRYGRTSEILRRVEESYDYQFFCTDDPVEDHARAVQYRDTGRFDLKVRAVPRAASEESELLELDFSVLAS
jgi:hypothetical protein